jgi:tellurite resistance protein TehA-like permease
MRQELPYGVVMATAGTSTVASEWGWQPLVEPLLGLAIAQALWILIAGAWRHWHAFRLDRSVWLMVGPVAKHPGIHTVPLGVAVIAGGLAALHSGLNTPWLLLFASVCLALAWLLVITCGSRFIAALAMYGLLLKSVDGAWFLVPAAILGASLSTQELSAHTAAPGATPLSLLALAGTLLGWLGYWVVALIALLRVRRFGLGGVPQAPWWIAMGCAGLAAAALGHVVEIPILPGSWQGLLTDAMCVTAMIAVILYVPIAWVSIQFLLWFWRFRGKAPWPPTFSTAVFALGCLQAGKILSSEIFHLLGLAAGLATIAFWAVTTLWNTIHGLTGLLFR